VTGQASGGQKLTQNPNVTATAGFGGDRWGANGGGIAPVGGGATDQTGYVKSVAAQVSDGELAANLQIGTPNLNVKGQESRAALSGQTNPNTLTPGSNQG
jgi:hypothetical protein